MILTRKSHNGAGTIFVQGDSAGGSKLIDQTLHALKKPWPELAAVKIYERKTHSLSSGKVVATPILKPVPSQFSPFIL